MFNVQETATVARNRGEPPRAERPGADEKPGGEFFYEFPRNFVRIRAPFSILVNRGALAARSRPLMRAAGMIRHADLGSV
jgi:hypothetical protein